MYRGLGWHGNYYDKNDNCINNFEKEKEKENDFNLKKEY